MYPEQLMWVRLKDIIGKLWNAQRHEDKYAKGVPDVSFGANGVQGWVELKTIPGWPKRAASVVTIEHYTQEQRLWLFLRGRGCWLLLKVGEAWLLFDHTAAWEVGRVTKQRLEKIATRIWIGNPKGPEFIQAITEKQKTPGLLNLGLNGVLTEDRSKG